MKDDAQNHISQMFGFWEVYFEDKEGKKMLSMAIPKNVTVYMWNDPGRIEYLDLLLTLI